MRLRLPLLATLVSVFVSGLIITAPAARAESPMTFQAVQLGGPGSTVIAATGQITQDTPAAFIDFLDQNFGGRNVHAFVFMDSPGGRVLAAMELGTLFRKVGATAVVGGVYSDGAGGSVITNAQCFSACVYAFMGARKRVVPARSQIGIHRMFMVEEGIDASGTQLLRRRRFDNGDMRAFLMRYSREMGVSPALIADAEHVSSDSLRILSRSEIRRYHLGIPRL